VMCNC